MTAQAQPRTTPEERARYRRRDHANIEDMQNLVIAEIAACAAAAYARAQPADEDPPDFTMPAQARHLISALQGVHGGGREVFEEFTRNYLTIGQRLQFTGTETAIRARVRRRVDELLAWQRLVGYELFSVVRGGEIVGREPDGTPIRKGSTFIDNLKPHADDGVQRARASEEWKAHPGRALAAQVGSVLKTLSRLKPEQLPAKDSEPQSLDQYEDEREAAIKRSVERVADKIEARGGDADLWLEKLETQINRIRQSRKRTERARRDFAALSIFDDEEPPEETGESAGLYNKNVTQATPETAPAQEVTEAPNAEAAASARPEETPQSGNVMLDEALAWAGVGLEIFPAHEIVNGICTCADGQDCRSPAKHPYWHAEDLPEGKKNATTDAALIRRWWTRWPNANIAARMGGAANLLAVDVDPRAGGSASLTDLTEAHGDEWLQTRCHKTGGGGWHFFFTLPEGLEVHRARLAPGIDLKHSNGYVLMPPSNHVAGWYMVENPAPVAIAPAWLVAELTRPRDAEPVIDFQDAVERRDQFGAGGRFFGQGERNNGLRNVALGRWVHGYAEDAADLFQQLRQVRDTRCAAVPNDPPPSDRELWDLVLRTTRKFARGELRREGAAR